MRIHLSQQVIILLRGLKEEGAPLRRAVEALEQNPTPADAITTPERPGRYETHVRVGQRGYWLTWQIEQDRGETVIRVTAIVENV
jgi:hypothetical protein